MSSLVDWVAELNPQMVVIEASGGYERDLVAALVEKNIPTAVVNPRQVRHFARATGGLAKTDILDAKKDGVPFKPTGAKQIAASAGGGIASSASASSESFGKQATGGEGASSKRFVHNPAAEAKSCVKMVQTSTSTDARFSGNFHFINECDVGVEIFWCFPRPDGRCANGGTWSVPAGRGWPVLDNEASIQWGACRGFGRFVYKDDDRNFTDGKSYYCE
jgi:hypothetical protein